MPTLVERVRQRHATPRPASDVRWTWRSNAAWLALLACALGLAYADRIAFSLAMQPIGRDLRLSDAALGALGGFAFALLYATASLPLARLSDSGRQRTVLAASVALWSAFTFLTGRAGSFATLFAARVGVGIGEAGAVPGVSSLVSARVPAERRTQALALCWFGAYCGLVVGLAAGGALVDRLGWRAAFTVLAVPGLPLAAGMLCLRRQKPVEPEPGTGLLAPWRSPLFRQLFVFGATGGFVAWGGLLWDATFYERRFGMSATQAGFWLGTALGAATAAGTLLSGFAARLRHPLRAAALALAASQPVQALCYLTGSEPFSLACMVVTALVGALTVGPVQSALQSSVPARVRATATAFYFMGASLLGAGLGPPFFGWLSDRLRPSLGDGSLRASLIASAILGLWPAWHLWRAARCPPNPDSWSS